MSSCQCEGIATLFDQPYVKKDLARYRKKGPRASTRFLIEALKAEGVQGKTLLDIGGGVGAVQHGLLQAGASETWAVEASLSYVRAATEEAERQGHAARMHLQHGNFIELAKDLPSADIVTLDRVICCYDDMPGLVGRSAARARELYAAVYPRDTWWVKLGLALQNIVLRVVRSPFRAFVHSTRAVERVLAEQGFKRRFYRRTFIWQVVVYGR